MNQLIAFEGGDGVGKATQSRRLADRFNADQRTHRGAVLYSFPRYDTPVGRAILRHLRGETALMVSSASEISQTISADDAMAFQALMLADKYDAAPEIEEHLRARRFVVCDRWRDSAKAYGAADGIELAWLERIHQRLTEPGLTILLQVPEAVALERRPVLRDRYERDRNKQAAVAMNYASFVQASKWAVIDGSGTPDDVAALVWAAVEKRFSL
jgi:dTMP kinase